MEHLQLLALTESVREVARERGGTLFADLRAPALESEVSSCAAAFDVPLQPSLRSFWSRHDGFSVRAYGQHDPPDDPVATYRFDLRGPTATLEATKRVRAYFRSMNESGAPGYDERRARRYADIAEFGDPDRRTVLDLARVRAAPGEAPIVEANLYERWPGDDASAVAESIDEMIERCLRFMIETQGGFRYWREPHDDW